MASVLSCWAAALCVSSSSPVKATQTAITVLGYIVGAAFAHNFGLAGAAASAESAGGPSIAGKVAVLIGLAVMLVVASLNIAKAKKNA